ncbi:hypothetical protein SAY87_005419 [Trapa incisa]|uniref:Magnesium transporter n=1 Tax=Trapa incisa TaxID=236973 RepID=A0AAN7K5U7_9MYRT|nr:hypothetical protein SAY87_005419 [Trapa incisa]
MGLSTDDNKGVVLALLSSGFIGGRFIIKKKGLRRAAAASGVRAGFAGYSYLLEPLWWLDNCSFDRFNCTMKQIPASLDDITTMRNVKMAVYCGCIFK